MSIVWDFRTKEEGIKEEPYTHKLCPVTRRCERCNVREDQLPGIPFCVEAP